MLAKVFHQVYTIIKPSICTMLPRKCVEIKSLHNVGRMLISIVPLDLLLELSYIVGKVYLDDYWYLVTVLEFDFPQGGKTQPALAKELCPSKLKSFPSVLEKPRDSGTS